jgi:hypothetical protein
VLARLHEPYAALAEGHLEVADAGVHGAEVHTGQLGNLAPAQRPLGHEQQGFELRLS